MVVFDKAYWLEHGKTYKDEIDFTGPAYQAQEKALLSVLSNLEFESVLEVGAGFGRITRLLVNSGFQGDYLATDVSNDALDELNKYMGQTQAVSRTLLDLDSANSEDYDKKWDLVLSVEVLMHRDNLIKDIRTLLSLSKKYVVIVGWWHPTFKGEAPGCYHHDLFKFTDLITQNQVMAFDIPGVKQAIWVITKGSEVEQEETV